MKPKPHHRDCDCVTCKPVVVRTTRLAAPPEPALREQIAEALRKAEEDFNADDSIPVHRIDFLAARVEAFARTAAVHYRPKVGDTLDDALLAALPAISAPPPERPAQTEEER